MQDRLTGSRGYPLSIFVISLFCFNLFSATNAAELVAFRTTNIDSHIELRYLSDKLIGTSKGVKTSDSQQLTYEEEFSVQTQNYVYHPNFLKLDLGASVTFNQDSIETETESNKNNDDSYSFNVRANFLEKKLYPISIYYSRYNPKSYSNLDDPIRQTDIQYGFDIALLEPLIPLKINFFATHDESAASSSTNLVDESSDRYGFRASKVYSENYSHRLDYDHSEESSSSGSLNLPLIPTSRTTDLFSYSSDWAFGAKHQINYHDNIRVTKRDGVISSEEIQIAPSLKWKHSDKLRTFYSYSYLDTSHNGFDTAGQSANARMVYIYDEQTSINGGITWDDKQTTNLENRSTGANGGISYQQPFTNSRLRLNTVINYHQNDRVAAASQSNIIGETIILSGLTPVPLVSEFIIASSIVVQNLARSQTYLDGVDYRVIVVGSRTEIQRLAGSNIGDPEQVIVDYAFQTGGSANFTSLEQFYSAGLSINRYYDFYLSYRIKDQQLKSGNPTLPLNRVDNLSFRASIDYPLNERVEIGANIELINHRESISPYDGQKYAVFGQLILPDSSNLNLRADQSIIDNVNSDEDTDLTSFSIILRSQPRDRMMVTAEAYNEKETGGTIPRKRDHIKLSAQWRFFQLFMKAEATFRNEKTGTSETEDTRIMVTLRRDI